MSGIPFGRYELLEPIGAGGMAEVWRARLLGAKQFAKAVVIKRILPHLSRNAEFSEMFTAEALLLARLDHPNIVQVIELSSVNDELFIAMEFLDGVDGLELVKRLLPLGPLPIGLALYVAREVARALAYAHALTDEQGQPLGLIHRDVSPSNVMVLFDGRVKLLDFGIAKAVEQTDRETRTGVIKGKLGYMSPEAVSADEGVVVDHRTDVFSCGALLHELLCGKRLFKGSTEIQTLDLIRRCEVPPPSRLRPDVEPGLDAIVLRALARDRAERYASADELATALSTALREHPWDADATARLLKERGIVAPERDASPDPTASAHPPRAAVAVAPPTATRRAWLVTSLALVALTAVGGAWWLHDGAPSTPPSAPALERPPRAPEESLPEPTAPAIAAPSADPAAPSKAKPSAGVPKGPRQHARGKHGHKVDLLGGEVFDTTDR